MISKISGQVTAVIFQRAREAVIESDPRRPSGQFTKPVVIRDKIADVDALALLGKLAPLEMPTAIGAGQRLGERQQ
jgi:hypothetical protein